MDSVVFDGVTYTKASVIAKNFRYTADYVGQLCRGKKVDARLVGRTWFINEASLIEHRKSKYSNITKKSDRLSTVADKLESGDSLRRVKVFPVLNTRVVKSLNHNFPKDLNKSVRKLKIAYELDDEFLIPTLIKKHYQAPKEIRIEHAESTKISISGEKSSMSFLPTPVPEVALSGKLKIISIAESVEDKELINDNALINKVISDEKPIVKVDNTNRRTLKFFSRKNKFLPEKKSKVNNVNNLEIVEEKKAALPLIKNKEFDRSKNDLPEHRNFDTVKTQNSFENKVISDNDVSPRQASAVFPVKSNLVKDPPLLIRIAPLLATMVALGVVLVILSASNVVIAGKFSYDSITIFSIRDLLSIIKY